MKTNILVQYQGGGYDGCIWEWNYFYIDKQGTFHDIQSSGCGGIGNKQDAERLIEQDKSGTYIYDLDNKQDIETFSNESHPVHVVGVLQWFGDYNSPDAAFFAVCSVCKGHIDMDDLTIEGDLLLCNECYLAGECRCCESYVGDTELVKVNPDEHDGNSYICSYCKEYHDEEQAKQDIEDLRFQSFCTGKPDMFSGELRDARIKNLTGGGL